MTEESAQTSIRDTISAYIKEEFDHELSLEWENMPAQSRQPEKGFIRAAIIFDRLESIGLKPSLKLQRGRVQFTIAVATGLGMALMDSAVEALSSLLGGKVIGGVRLGSVRAEREGVAKGYEQLILEIRFVANI